MNPLPRASRRLLVAGMACLALANAIHWFAQRNHLLDTDLDDGLYGLMMGVAIGLSLLALYRRRGGTPG